MAIRQETSCCYCDMWFSASAKTWKWAIYSIRLGLHFDLLWTCCTQQVVQLAVWCMTRCILLYSALYNKSSTDRSRWSSSLYRQTNSCDPTIAALRSLVLLAAFLCENCFSFSFHFCSIRLSAKSHTACIARAHAVAQTVIGPLCYSPWRLSNEAHGCGHAIAETDLWCIVRTAQWPRQRGRQGEGTCDKNVSLCEWNSLKAQPLWRLFWSGETLKTEGREEGAESAEEVKCGLPHFQKIFNFSISKWPILVYSVACDL